MPFFLFNFGERDEAIDEWTRIVTSRPKGTDPIGFAALYYGRETQEVQGALKVLRDARRRDNPFFEVAEQLLYSGNGLEFSSQVDDIKLESGTSDRNHACCAKLAIRLLSGGAKQEGGQIFETVTAKAPPDVDPVFRLVVQLLAGDMEVAIFAVSTTQ